MTTFLMSVLVNDGYAGAKQLLWLCFDPAKGNVLAVHPQGYYNFFSETFQDEDEARARLNDYLVDQHKADPDVSLRIEALRTYMANRGWNNGVTLLYLLCCEASRGQESDEAFTLWVKEGSTLRLFDLTRKVKDCAQKMLSCDDTPYPYENAVYSIDTAYGYLAH